MDLASFLTCFSVCSVITHSSLLGIKSLIMPNASVVCHLFRTMRFRHVIKLTEEKKTTTSRFYLHEALGVPVFGLFACVVPHGVDVPVGTISKSTFYISNFCIIAFLCLGGIYCRRFFNIFFFMAVTLNSLISFPPGMP